MISLKTAVLVSFVLIITIMIASIVFIWTSSNNRLIEIQSTRALFSLTDNIKLKVNKLLSEPHQMNRIFAKMLTEKNSFSDQNLDEIRKLEIGFIKETEDYMPQISVISYGDENKNFVGMRVNKGVIDNENEYSLMIKDKRTKDLLHIYDGNSMESNLIASYENYDPQTRPWYTPVKQRKIASWSEVYFNNDERQEATISSLTPVFDATGKFQGVADIDVKLSGIQQFLMENTQKGNGVVYIVDKDWRLIAQSGKHAEAVGAENSFDKQKTLFSALDSSNPLIYQSAKQLKENAVGLNVVKVLKLAGKTDFALISELDELSELDWRIIAVMPESDLLGNVKEQQQMIIGFVVLLGLAGVIVGGIILSKVTEPIMKSADAALEMAEGKLTANINLKGMKLRETDRLVKAFNRMSYQIKEAFTRVQQSEEKYRSLVENTDSMIFSISPEGVFHSANSSLEAEIRMPRARIIGRKFDQIPIIRKKRRYWENMLKEVLSEKEKMIRQEEFSIRFVENMKIQRIRKVLRITFIPILDKKREVIMILGTATNITALIEAREEVERLLLEENSYLEDEVSKRTEDLENAMKELMGKERLASLGDLVTGITHEINTPLGVAVSAGSFLEKSQEFAIEKINAGSMTKQEFSQHLKNMEEGISIVNFNLHRAANLVKSFKKIAVDRNDELPSKFNLSKYINDILLSLSHEIKKRNHEIDLICDEELSIESYPGAFSQIITNFIMNAMLHGYEIGESGRMRLEVQKKDKQLTISFSDNGKGISSEIQSKIFEPFFTTKRGSGGSGLGLHIVYNLVNTKLQGKIYCVSGIGYGTEFNIIIPL